MQIQINWEDQAPEIAAAVVYPYPDLRRLWLRVALTAFAEYPNLDVVITDPDGHVVASLSAVEVREQELAYTLHLRQAPQPAAVYHAHLLLTRGDTLLHQLTVDFPLTFVEPAS